MRRCCHGDLVLQNLRQYPGYGDSPLRDVIKHTPDLLSVRWEAEGFISDSAARNKG